MQQHDELTGALSQQDVRRLQLLDRMVSRRTAWPKPPTPARPSLLDLERVAAVVASDQPRMVFQPIVDLATGEVTGYEALARFDGEPEWAPDIWFAHAARVGLGMELELKAVQKALAALDQLHDRYSLAVNVSAGTLCSAGLDLILQGLPSYRVTLELTEHELIEDYDAVNAAADRLRSRGYALAVDDAGAGCAGLSHILRLCPDVIKIDRAITRSIDLFPERQEMARSIVALGRCIKATVVAEGIETAEERDTLDAIGVRRGQGWYTGLPEDTPWTAPATRPVNRPRATAAV